MLGFGPLASAPLGAVPEHIETTAAIDSADWTGIERRLEASPAAVQVIRSKVVELDTALEAAGLTNAECAKAKAMTAAILKLVESPEPEWKIIARLVATLMDSKAINSGLNAAALGNLAWDILKAIFG